jgi:two-component system, NarL family, invasion response regulator UvrY
MNPKMRVLIVDDHPVVRQGVKLILTLEPDIEVVGEAASAREAIARIHALLPDFVVLDLNLPDQNGFVVLQDLQRDLPKLPVLVLSVQPEEHMAVRALKAGAAGFLNKESAPEDLVKALRTIAAGRRYISPRFAEWLALDASGRRESLPHERLSERELQVMLLLAAGRGISEIAAEIHRSANTISTYRTRILAKMGLPGNAALTEYAIAHQLIR